MRSVNFFLIIIALLIFSHPTVRADDYLQVPGLIDLRTTYSDGELELESLVRLAKARGFDVLFINDHDRLAMEYGLFPFRNILKKRVELHSINKAGPDKYLAGIKKIQEKHPDMIIIPGSETAPFYYWTGSYFKKNLTAHNHEKRILIIGLENPEDYKELPILHNGFSNRYFKRALPLILFFVFPLALGIMLLKWKGLSRISGVVICGFSLLFMVNTDPFRSSPFDQYHGDQGIAPYQEVVDYVDKRGGLTFWNYPETRSGKRKLGPIIVDTPPYPEVLERSKGYTGFAALYGDTITITEPGNEWDRALLEYCRRKRDRPVWGISTADFHKDAGAGEKLGNFPTVFLVRERTKKEILFAMRLGRMYACRAKYPQRMVLNDFSVCSAGGNTRAVSGGEIVLNEKPRIHVFLSLKKPTKNRVKLRLIRSGRVLEVFDGSLPMEIDYEDKYFKPGRKGYYRIDARGCGALVSNPIFVTLR